MFLISCKLGAHSYRQVCSQSCTYEVSHIAAQAIIKGCVFG